jgi:hypothetical protein
LKSRNGLVLRVAGLKGCEPGAVGGSLLPHEEKGSLQMRKECKERGRVESREKGA